ncbi:MAG: hypothetical protein K2X93_19335 [Candidatus Obscuribacterales bacterium]|nr:hypothetical protein [Candidatus Obscuribacterales bacterium]
MGLTAWVLFKGEAFPYSLLKVDKSRVEIQMQARTIAAGMGFVKDNHIESTIFINDYYGKTFLEHVYWLKMADQLMLQEVPVWYWKSRFCKEFDQEEFYTWLSPEGKIVGFEHRIANDVEIKSVSHEKARRLAWNFIESVEPNWKRYSVLIADRTITRNMRTDHSFTWEDSTTNYMGAHLRIYAYISGDKITAYSKRLHVPESWIREFASKRSYHKLLALFAGSFTKLFGTLAYLIAVWGIVSGNIRWRIAVTGGVILGGLSAIDYWNDWPEVVSQYNTTISFNNYVSGLIVPALQRFASQTLIGMSLFAGAEIVYRKMFPQKMALENLLTRAGLSDFSVLQSTIVGQLLVGVSLGWIVLYYGLGRYFHFWCPLSVDSSKVLGDVVPFVAAVSFGTGAAFHEELACRVVGLGVGWKLFKNFWIANLFQAMFWGFAHSTYAQEPAYVRGIELTVEGMVLGCILRRYGLVACVVWHYTIDAFLRIEPFLRSDLPELKLSVIPAVVLALMIVGIARIQSNFRNQPDSKVLMNECINFKTAPTSTTESAGAFETSILTTKARVLLTAFFVLILTTILILPQPQTVNGDIKFGITRDEAFTAASGVIARHGIDSSGCWTQASTFDNFFDAQYLFEKSSLSLVKSLLHRTRREVLWKIRYFKPGQTEEYTVYLDSKGKEVTLAIARGENEEGPSLSQEQAQSRAEEYLRTVQADLPKCMVKHISAHKRKHVTDYTVEFVCPSLDVSLAACRITVDVIGTQVGNYHQWWDLPDSWLFEQQKRVNGKAFWDHVHSVFNLAVFLLFIWWCYSVLKGTVIKIRFALALTCVWAVLLIIDQVNGLPLVLSGYRTVTPINVYVFGQVLYDMSRTLQASIASFILCVVALTALRNSGISAVSFRPFLGSMIGTGNSSSRLRFDVWIDAILIAFASIAFCRLLVTLTQLVLSVVSPQLMYTCQSCPLFIMNGSVPYNFIAAICNLANAGSPALFIFSNTVKTILQCGAFLVVITAMFTRYAPTFWRAFAAASVSILIYYSADQYWQNYIVHVVQAIVLFLFCYFMVKKVARNNCLAYVSFFALGVLVPYLEALAIQDFRLFFTEAIVLVVMIIILPFTVVMAGCRSAITSK